MAAPAKAAPDKAGMGVLTDDAGPLPVWGWLAVGVAVVFLYRRIFQGSSSTTAAASTTSPTAPGSGTTYVVTPDLLGAAPSPYNQGTSTPATQAAAVNPANQWAFLNQGIAAAGPAGWGGREYLEGAPAGQANTLTQAANTLNGTGPIV